MTTTHPSIRPLTTERLDLVPLDPDRDAESLHAMLGDQDFHLFGDGEVSRDVDRTRARLAEQVAGNGGLTWAIRLRPDTAAIGTVGVFYDQGTPIRGLDWGLSRRHWGRGIMSEAARAAVDNLLAQPGIDGVEAWIDSRNTRSLGVARHARLDERSRLPRTTGDHVGQSIVMARSAVPRDPSVFACRPSLAVRDLPATADLLARVFELHVPFMYGDPPTFARLGVSPWSDSPGLELSKATGDITTVSFSIDIGIATDTVYDRALAEGLPVSGPPENQPWHRREFELQLPEGHRIRVIGPAPGA